MEEIFNAKVSTGKKKFSARYDIANDLLLIETNERPVEGKANLEIMKELKRLLKVRVEIISGKNAKQKRLKIRASRKEVIQKLTQN